MSLLHINGLQVHFQTEAGLVRAVDGVDLELESGRTLGIVGESGCGKSVTMLSVMRLIQPPGRIMAGSILFEGRDLLALSREEMRQVRGGGIGMVFQDPMTSLNPVLSVGEQIAEAIEIHKRTSRRRAWSMAVEAMERVSIPDAADRAGDYPHQFSGGMRQRIMIAMAIACKPRLLIADEPTTALDVTVQAQILNLLRDLQAENKMSIIVITHDLRVAAQLCHDLAVFYAGRVMERGNAEQILSNPGHPYTIALRNSIPGFSSSGERLQTIGGNPPNLIDKISGCVFHPRCPTAHSSCSDLSPVERFVSDGRSLACDYHALGEM